MDPESTPAVNLSEAMFNGMLKNLEPSLAPGGADQLRLAVKPAGTPAQVAGKLVSYLEGGFGSRVLAPDRTVEPNSLRRVAALIPGIDPEKVSALAAELHGTLGHLPPATQARRIVERLEDRSFGSRFLATSPPPPAREARLAAVMTEHFGQEIPSGAVAKIAAAWAPELGGFSGDELVQALARRLALGATSQRFGTGKLEPDDGRLKYRSPLRPAAVSTTPAKPAQSKRTAGF